ncbi:MAG: cytochrome c maturation protein CcmE [Thermoanaerobaculia bacterium]
MTTEAAARSEQRRRRLLVVGALVVAGGVLAFLAFGGIGENLVYYWTPSELLAAGDKGRGASVRLGGQVVAGSIAHDPDGGTLRFAVTDGEATVPIVARAVPPAMFREGIGVVVEGRLGTGGAFETSRLMVKHDNEYRAPGEGEEPDMERLVGTLESEN